MPSYVNGDDVQDVVPCYFSTDSNGMYTDDEGWMTIPIAAINWYICTKECSSWSHLKTMYR